MLQVWVIPKLGATALEYYLPDGPKEVLGLYWCATPNPILLWAHSASDYRMVECEFIMRFLFYQNYLTTPSSCTCEKPPDAGGGGDEGFVLVRGFRSSVHHCREGIVEFVVIKAPASIFSMVVATKLKPQLEQLLHCALL